MTSLAQKMAQYAKIHASNCDLNTAKQAALFLIKKGWHYEPWEKRGSIYFQQSAFVTSLVVSYARPFTASRGWPSYPGRLVRLSDKQRELHEKLMRLRNGVHAHSDSEFHSYRPVRFRFNATTSFATAIERTPSLKIPRQECLEICDLINTLLSSLIPRLEELREELADATEEGES